MQRSLGLTLVELLIAMSIGILLTSLTLEIYRTQLNLYYNLQDELFLQTQSRLALLILTNKIRTAGYIGCMRLRPGMTTQLTPDNQIDLSIAQQITIRQLATQPLKGKPDAKAWIGVSNCRQLHVVTGEQLANIVTKNDYVAPFLIETFSLRAIQNEGQAHSALYQKTNQDNAIEIVPGVDQLQATLIESNRAIELTLHFTAPHSATLIIHKIIALREVNA